MAESKPAKPQAPKYHSAVVWEIRYTTVRKVPS